MNNIKKHKRLIAAIVVILLAVLVEIFANRSAWGHAYDLDITDHMYRLYFLLQKDFMFRCAMCSGSLKMKSSMI